MDRVVHFHNAVNGQLTLTNCEVHIHHTADQVIVNFGRVINHGSIDMMIRNGSVMQDGNEEPKVVYRDRIVKERVFVPDMGNKQAISDLESENRRLQSEVARLRREIQQRPVKEVVKREVVRSYMKDPKKDRQIREACDEIRRLNEKLEHMKKNYLGEPADRIRELEAALAYEKQLRQNMEVRKNRRIRELEENVEGLQEANHNQALRIDRLTRQKTVTPKRSEYCPTDEDLRFISQNLHLFIGHNELNPEAL